MKKLVALLLTLCLCVSACSALAETVLKLGIYPEDIDTAAIESHEFYIAEMAKAMPDVTVEKARYKYATDTFVPLAEGNGLPTVFETWFTEPQKLIKGGYVADITDELAELGWADQMTPSVKTMLSDENGRIYGVPRDAYTLGLMINAELFADAGLVDENGIPTYPKTWEEVCTYGKAIKDATGSAGFCLLAMDNAGGWHFCNIAWDYGAVPEVQDENGKWLSELNTPEMLAAVQLVYDMKWKYDILTADPTSENWGTGFAQLGTGSAAMYIAANDATSNPVEQGLELDQLMYVPVPAGPAAQYGLTGGTPYMFAANATHDEIMAGLKYLEIMGKGPVVDETAMQGKINDAKYKVDNNYPVVKSWPAWSSPEFAAADDEIVATYGNVKPEMFNAYYEAAHTAGYMKGEEPQYAQEMYAELTKVLQAVVTDQNCDLQALLDTADANFQAILDQYVNK